MGENIVQIIIEEVRHMNEIWERSASDKVDRKTALYYGPEGTVDSLALVKFPPHMGHYQE